MPLHHRSSTILSKILPECITSEEKKFKAEFTRKTRDIVSPQVDNRGLFDEDIFPGLVNKIDKCFDRDGCKFLNRTISIEMFLAQIPLPLVRSKITYDLRSEYRNLKLLWEKLNIIDEDHFLKTLVSRPIGTIIRRYPETDAAIISNLKISSNKVIMAINDIVYKIAKTISPMKREFLQSESSPSRNFPTIRSVIRHLPFKQCIPLTRQRVKMYNVATGETTIYVEN